MANSNPLSNLLTTEALGLASVKAEDLTGYILNGSDIQDAVVRVFSILGVNTEDIRRVKSGCDEQGEARIIAEVKYKAVRSDKQRNKPRLRGLYFREGDDSDNREGLSQDIYEGLKNVAYPAGTKLIWDKITRGDEKFARIEFNAPIFIAFAYNINFADSLYKISAPATRWPNEDELDELSGKERKNKMRIMNEYKNDGLRMATFYVTFCKNHRWKVTDDNGNETWIDGFDRSQVEAWYEDLNKNKKKKHK